MYDMSKVNFDIGEFTTPIKFYKKVAEHDEYGGKEEKLVLDFTIFGKVEYRQGQLYEAFNSIDTTRPLKITLISNGKIDYNHILDIGENKQYKIKGMYLNANNMFLNIDVDDIKAK
jgi:SPP1 family predicted phage head-tail adaptor